MPWDFEAWLGEVTRLALRWQRGKLGYHYRLPLSLSASVDMWKDLFEHGLTPLEAFKDDLADWDEYYGDDND